MAIEMGGGLLAKLEAHKKRVKERKFAKAQRRADRKLRQGEFAPPDGKMRAGYSEAYAEGWDRIFGKKAGDSVQGEGSGLPEVPAVHLRGEDPAGSDPG